MKASFVLFISTWIEVQSGITLAWWNLFSLNDRLYHLLERSYPNLLWKHIAQTSYCFRFDSEYIGIWGFLRINLIGENQFPTIWWFLDEHPDYWILLMIFFFCFHFVHFYPPSLVHLSDMLCLKVASHPFWLIAQLTFYIWVFLTHVISFLSILQILDGLLKLPENKLCADCKAK